ncbi:ribonuclease HII [Thalassococcus sp. CAU 1522]|uniref:Ribonuclease HII n=1 Tax=Thalassococcus arenae TaxID=2851652 RepID=A0ABS6N7I7_9RHOB|nr:ribonuclease HII [Thalassococcus arenae]MBV2359981.1 ribonuclease HII [Thalassococcus arenae]
MAGPDTTFETPFWQAGKLVAGVDEVGRGPLAGPVVAAAVLLDPARIPDGLNDSKTLSAARRDTLAVALQDCATVSVAQASVEEIDAINILQASLLAMQRAIDGLPRVPDHVLVDGNRLPRLAMPATPIVRGDSRSVSIAAASIVAKTWRDRVMKEIATQFPGYGWETNAGYPTKSHKTALQNLGITPHHRRSFKPVYNILYQEKNVTD